jgi:molecular chaperone GrpE
MAMRCRLEPDQGWNGKGRMTGVKGMEENLKKKKNHKNPACEKQEEKIEEAQSNNGKELEGGEGKEIEELKRKLEEKEKEAKENYERMLRVAADFENYKKRAAREKEEWTKFANEDLLKAILPFIDNLEKAVNHSDKTENAQSLVEGVRLTLQQLLQALGKFGLTPMESVGKPFDPTYHEAMMTVQTDQHEPNRVVEEYRKGYLLNERLIRPATVSVSKASEKESQTTE